jgi:hypothetical protein
LVASRRPVILAHPNAFDTDLSRVPPACLVEVNSRTAHRRHVAAVYMIAVMKAP